MPSADTPRLTRAQREAMAHTVPFWWHSIDLGDGVVSNGYKSAGHLARELRSLRLPDLKDKTVLDIGAWDGFYSFAAEQRGARQVVALDYFTWSLDLPAYQRYEAECRRQGVHPRPAETMPFWKPAELPGKRGFDVAHRARNSAVEAVAADFMTVDLDRLGAFDVVLYLGVLYHLENPLASLRRLAAVTRDLAVIETAAITVPGYEGRALCEFFERDELGADYTNWWAPNEAALHGMCRAAGFRHVRTVAGATALPVTKRLRSAARYGAAQLAPVISMGRWHPAPSFTRPRLVVHARK
jgi:tRNA (mo5U34)-methyltransferase